ncbi:MAG: hypothetical protein COA79_20045 [Planctomycetota bacterium]|nr:MAG: hypothetical protein COA79_20045 [Planctomycetota bacterium]
MKNKVFWRILILFSISIMIGGGYTGPSCGYGVIDDSVFDEALSAPTFTISESDGEVTVTWTDVTDAISYNVFIDSNFSILSDVPVRSNVQSPQTIDSLDNGTEYFIALQSVNAEGLVSVIPTESTSFTPNAFFLQLADKDITGTDAQLDTVKALKELVGKNISLSDKTDNQEAYDALNALKSIDLTSKSIVDVTPLKGFKLLEELILNENEITDISSLSELESLLVLKISKTKITSASVILSLEKLTELDVTDNDGLLDTATFDLSSLFIQDGTQDSILKDFRTLIIPNCNIVDLSSIAWLTELTHLDLKDNKELATLSPIVNFSDLTFLDVTNNNFNSDDADFDILKTRIEVTNSGTVTGP